MKICLVQIKVFPKFNLVVILVDKLKFAYFKCYSLEQIKKNTRKNFLQVSFFSWYYYNKCHQWINLFAWSIEWKLVKYSSRVKNQEFWLYISLYLFFISYVNKK